MLGLRTAPRTLWRYVAREVLAYSGLALLGTTGILLAHNLTRRAGGLVEVGITFSDLIQVGGALALVVVSYAAPISFLFGVLFATLRLSSDSEMTAMRTCGLGPGALVAPTLALGLVFSLATAYVMIEVEHQARHDVRATIRDAVIRGGFIEAHSFQRLGDRVIYVDRHDAERRQLEGVLIEDRSNGRPFILVSARGRYEIDEAAEEIRFSLIDGDIHLPPGRSETDRYRRISFETLDYPVQLSQIVGDLLRPVRPKQMSLAELREVVTRAAAGDTLRGLHERNPVAYTLEAHRRFALPWAPALFALLAVPLGSIRARSPGAVALLLCLLTAAGYYLLGQFGQILAEREQVPPALAVWAPNAIFGLLAAALLWRSRSPGGLSLRLGLRRRGKRTSERAAPGPLPERRREERGGA